MKRGLSAISENLHGGAALLAAAVIVVSIAAGCTSDESPREAATRACDLFLEWQQTEEITRSEMDEMTAASDSAARGDREAYEALDVYINSMANAARLSNTGDLSMTARDEMSLAVTGAQVIRSCRSIR